MLRTASAPTGRGAEPDVGEMFGRYRLEQQLGAGGVGEVWRAHDTSLDRVVAIKTLLPRYRDDPDSAARFHREARMAARLRHPHIVRVHAAGEIDRRLYLDMELVEGDSVAAALAAGPIDAGRAARIVEVVADALDHAHALDGPPEQRMVHRDVKPANILLEPRPRGREHAYLVDFGVARTVAAGPQITGVGAVVGTPAYMAPELWEGRDSDHRVDVYALAVTAFELLTGVLPFPRATVEGLVTAHLTEPPPAATGVRPDLPAAVDAVLAAGMAKEPGARPATAGEFADALLAALLAPAGPAPDPVTTRIGRDRSSGTSRPPADARGSGPAGAAAAPTRGTLELRPPTTRAGTPPATPSPAPPPSGNPPAGSRPADPPPSGSRPSGDRPSGDRPSGDRPSGDRPSGDRPSGDRPGTTRPPGNPPPGVPHRAPQTPAVSGGSPPGRHPLAGPAGGGPYGGPTPRASAPPPVPPAVPGPAAKAPYLSSPPHFAGLAATVLLVPLYLLDLVPANGVLLAVAALLYALGAVLTAVLRR